MKPQKQKLNLKNRSAEKGAARKSDKVALADGVSPYVIHRQNSIFPEDYFQRNNIINFASAIGK